MALRILVHLDECLDLIIKHDDVRAGFDHHGRLLATPADLLYLIDAAEAAPTNQPVHLILL